MAIDRDRAAALVQGATGDAAERGLARAVGAEQGKKISPRRICKFTPFSASNPETLVFVRFKTEMIGFMERFEKGVALLRMAAGQGEEGFPAIPARAGCI